MFDVLVGMLRSPLIHCSIAPMPLAARHPAVCPTARPSCSGTAHITGCTSRRAINGIRRRQSSPSSIDPCSNVARVVWPANATQSSRQSACCHAVDQEQELRSAVEQFVSDLESDGASTEGPDAAVAGLQMQLADANAKVRMTWRGRGSSPCTGQLSCVTTAWQTDIH